jgi:manganese/zinc/iron transport system permease protein
MTAAQVEIQLIASVTAVACALPGVFLVLRRLALVSDAISHSILLGIVLAFFVTKDLTSPFLFIAAALTGLLMVGLVELINRTKLVKEDAAIGLVFPVLFSIGVILISRYAGDVHLDTDAVLMGELAFAPFDRLVILGNDIGPRGLYVMGGVLMLNLLFITVFYKELKLATFDHALAATLGFLPAVLHYTLMGFVSLTAVGAFDIVGSILVVALMIAPPAAAYMITDKLSRMLIYSGIIGMLSAVLGYWVAHWLDASIAGAMATMSGVLFILAFLSAPERGILAIQLRRQRQKWEFSQSLLAIHLMQHQDLPEASRENHINHLGEHIRWDEKFANDVLKRSVKRGIITLSDGLLVLTPKGRTIAEEAIVK